MTRGVVTNTRDTCAVGVHIDTHPPHKEVYSKVKRYGEYSMKITQIIKALSCFFIIAGSCYTSVQGPYYDDVRALGMGNTTVSVTTDRTAIFHNPAGLCLIKDKAQISFTPIAFSIDGVFFSLLDQMIIHGHKLEDLALIDDEFIDMINKYDGQWVGLEYIPEVTVATKRMGFGMYSVFPIGVRIESGHLIPKLVLRGQRDLVFTWSVGFPLRSENNYGGISIEYLQRTPLEMMTTYSETFHLFNEISESPLGIIGDYSKIKHGVSLDVGFMHNLKNGFRLAWDVKDVLGIVGGSFVVPPQVDLGCAYYFPQVERVKAIRNLILAFEITNVFGIEPITEKYEQFLKKMHFGAELDLNYVALRLGLSQGYPTAGFGLRFGMFKADYSFFTEELGYYAGQLPKNKHILALGIEINVPDEKAQRANIQLGNLYNKAMTLYSQGKYYEALYIYGEILTDYPEFFKNDWVQLYYSLCQEYMDMREIAKVNFIKTRRRYSKSDVVPYSALGVMRLHYRNGKSSSVAKMFKYLNTPQTPDSLKYHAYYYQGEQYLRDGEYQKAIEILRNIPEKHPEYIFAQHSLAVTYALNDEINSVPDVLYNIIQMTPENKEEEEVINRSLVFFGYIFYEGLGGQKRQFSNAVAALRKVPETSYYYEDALLGLAWCGASASQWEDCLNACKTLRTVSKKKVIHFETLLLEAYIKILHQEYEEALSILSDAEKEIKALGPPSKSEKNASVLEYGNKRKAYDKTASEINRIALTKQTSSTKKQIDSLRTPQVDQKNKLKELSIFFDEFERRSFFARNIEKVRFDIEFALIKTEKIINQKAFERKVKKEVKEAKQIDDEMKKLEEELKTLEKDKKKE